MFRHEVSTSKIYMSGSLCSIVRGEESIIRFHKTRIMRHVGLTGIPYNSGLMTETGGFEAYVNDKRNYELLRRIH